MMTPERWRTIGDILEQALELAPEKRARFLDVACSSDSSLRGEVQSFLSAHENVAPGILDRPPLRSSLLAPGTVLGEYEILAQIGEGGMGVVYRARDKRLDRPVAIKVIREHILRDADKLRRFEQEARAAAAINHPNILAVHQFGEYRGAPYLVSELLEGETLRDEMKRGLMSQSRTMELAEQIAEGLTAAHRRGITHRDLKPENLFVTREQQLKILDFGLAKLREAAQCLGEGDGASELHTNPGIVTGTVGYTSPEQLRGEKLDARTDVFSFGVILYEMATGRRPFVAETSIAVIDATLNQQPTLPNELSPAVSGEIERIIVKALEKDREVRYQSAAEIRADLKRLKRGAEASNSGARGLTTQPRQLSKRHGGLSWITRSLIAAALVVLTSVGLEYASIREWLFHQLSARFSSSRAQFGSPTRDTKALGGENDGLLKRVNEPRLINTWSAGAAMPYPVISATAVTLGGKIYVIGGRAASEQVAYTQIYSPDTNRWSLGAPLPFAVEGSMGVSFGSYVYIIGGGSGHNGRQYVGNLYQYNPATNVWVQKASMPTPRSAAAAAVIGGRIYVVGGDAPTAYWVPNLESYDPMSDAWSELAPMKIGEANLSAAAFGNTLVVSGGYSAVGGMNGRTSVYDVTTNAWTSGTSSLGIDGACSGVVQGRFYLLGGGVFGGDAVDTTQIFDPSADTWTQGAAMPKVNGGSAGAVYNGKIYCFGGGKNIEGSATYDTVEIYSP